MTKKRVCILCEERPAEAGNAFCTPCIEGSDYGDQPHPNRIGGKKKPDTV